MKPTFRRLLLLIAIVVALVGGVAAYYRETQPDLLPLGVRARQVAAFESAETHYWWLTEHEVLLLRGATPERATFVRHNIDNGVENPLTALTTLYRESAGKIETVHTSPTGDWVLWSGERNATCVATLDGRRHYQVQEPGPRYNVWKYAGDGWYALHLDADVIDQVTEHNVDDPRKIAAPTVIAHPFPNDLAAINLNHITPASDTQLLVPLWKGGMGKLDRADILVTGFGASPQSVKTLKIPPPYLNSGGDVALSPWSSQMAWRLDILLPRAQFWTDLGLGDASRYSVGFWINDQKTGHSFSFGYVEVDRKAPASRPTDLQFSPVGKYFSFVQHKALWVVATE